MGQNTNGQRTRANEKRADDGILSLVIDRNEPLGAYQVLLRFDPTVVQFSQDDILGGSAAGFDSRPLAVAMDNASGQLRIASFQIGNEPQGSVDVAHIRVRLLRPILTTESVLIEYLNYFAAWGPHFRRTAAASVQAIMDNQTVRLVPHSNQVFLLGLNLYRARPDKGYSLTDCISMEKNGILSYSSNDDRQNRELVWFDRTGKKIRSVSKPGQFTFIALSPDEKTVAANIGNFGNSDIWLVDLQRDVLSRLTFHSSRVGTMAWSPDGGQLAFSFGSTAAGTGTIYRKLTAGNGREEVILQGGVNAAPTDWSPDGKFIVYQQTGSSSAMNISLLPLSATDSGSSTPVPYLQTPFSALNGRLSPDGKWMAYLSNESGSFQFYIQPVPANGAKWQISTSVDSAFGFLPQWRRDGKELYYISPDQKVMAVPITLGSTLEPGTPQALFGIQGLLSFVRRRDGRAHLLQLRTQRADSVAPRRARGTAYCRRNTARFRAGCTV